MTAKEYLNQAFRLDQRINSKIEQVAVLNDLATKCTATISGMPHSASPNTASMAMTIDKIVDLQNEINADIDELVDLKREIISVIKSIENTEYQLILEKKYLTSYYDEERKLKRYSWEQIAVDLGYDFRYLKKLHKKALECVKIPEES